MLGELAQSRLRGRAGLGGEHDDLLVENYEGTETVEEGAAEALLGPDGPTGKFTHATMGELPW